MTTGFLWLAASAGLLSLLTPCVFPMVPVTIAYFSPAGNRAFAWRRAMYFGAGIIGTFTVLGLTLAAAFGAAGLNRFAADPAVNLGLAAIFVLFAANLFDVLPVRLPSRLLTAADRSARDASHSGSAGALVVGAIFTLTSVTCTAPFVGTLLVLAARGSWSMPLVGMLVYSIAFALPFVILALTPGFIARLPRAGEWIRTLRVLIGLLELGAAIKFVANADLVSGWGWFTRSAVLASWTALVLIGAIYLVRSGIKKPNGRSVRPASFLPAAIALMAAAWLATGISGRPLRQLDAFLPPASNSGGVSRATGPTESWILNDYDGALGAARTTGKLVFIDFTGYTCTNCRWMEANIFSRPDVGAELGKFVLSRLYTDGDGALYERQQAFQEKTFGTVALPLYAIVDEKGNVRATLSGLTRDPAAFIDFLRKGHAPRVASIR